MSGAGRVGDMLRRLERRLEQAGLSADGTATILEVLDETLERRARTFGDEHFETLHPARTVLILLDDCDIVDGDVLAAATSIESEHPALRPARASDLALLVPLPDRDGEALLEELLAGDASVRLIALAERLDHARHLHLRERSVWPGFHHDIGTIYAPVAARTHERLARRFDWWWRTFRDRFLVETEPR